LCTVFISRVRLFPRNFVGARCLVFHPLQPASWCLPSTTFSSSGCHHSPSKTFILEDFFSIDGLQFLFRHHHIIERQLSPTAPSVCVLLLHIAAVLLLCSAVFHGLCCMGFLEKFARVSVTFPGCQLLSRMLGARVECFTSS